MAEPAHEVERWGQLYAAAGRDVMVLPEHVAMLTIEELQQRNEFFYICQGALSTDAQIYLHAIRRELAQRMDATGDYAYLMRTDNNGYPLYKIGRSTDPERRLRQICIPGVFEVELIHTIRCGDAGEVESFLHNRFADKRHVHEWFRLDPEDVQYIKSLAVRS